ncbi:hypothetical protein CRM90_09295 [Mycobacterium sp. ENV421]|nr:hypothetical protein CRM90_09295 [Mycobacterium sp. ENV421]
MRRDRDPRDRRQTRALGVGQPGQCRGQQLLGAIGEAVVTRQRDRITDAVDEIGPQLVAEGDRGGTDHRRRPGPRGDQAGCAHGDTQRFGHPAMITKARCESHSGAPIRHAPMT